MSTDIDFVKFVRQRKHAKPDMEDLYEIDFLGRKKEGISFNDTVRNDVKKPKLQEGETSLSDFLTKNKNKIIEEPKKEIIKRKESEEEENDVKEERDNSDNESEDYSEERINHYIGGEKNNIDEMQEIINEIKDRAQINKSKRNKKDKKDKKDKKEKNKNKEEISLDEEECEEIKEKPKKKNKKEKKKDNKDDKKDEI